jgi:alkanesulfonate monooxygenase SsuD/methylene tetrahydromethanopterin reductase-like flavin-dependent oxidoreductase (luciferase family)
MAVLERPAGTGFRVGVSPSAASRRGFDRVSDAAAAGGVTVLALGEGYLVDPNYPLWAGGQEPITHLAYLAGRYPQVDVVVSASILPLRAVDWLAKQIATLDQLTQGHAAFALAPGYWDKEFEFAGQPFADRGQLFDQKLEELLDALAGRRQGGTPGRLSPEPFTSPHPELWLAGGRPTFDKALARGFGFASQGSTPAALAGRARAWFAAGGGKLAVHAPIFPAGEPASGAAVASRLRGFRDLGLAAVWLSLPPGDQDALAAVKLLTAEALPALADRP